MAYQACGTVIHKEAIIGKNCHIAQNVTIGGRSGYKEVPVVGDRVFIGCNACILGPITVGDDVQIGAGAVVLHDLPTGSIAVGVPARVIKKPQ